ncbi:MULTISPECIES: efflux RND transporter permease subunit [Legionella]|uniref:Efflux RND transporter permease subunit n=1 Tax=Legionella septentrionalis TaxID=2498109 RepID=A0A433JII3_9GAMM|nr:MULTISPECIES: efflux RND transporter permease subunit [Legionella]MCP0913374.1 efflux RND transporter permease subunit [Legionella sp. 27cVA30]RUQ85092.1 efflux RND transporter permease subunit [Legionella septentrionalis]RUQ95165.1 efflux RND transporter permease subunit [Legionella septentrionalis]
MWLVRYALSKPYSIGALALLISILGFLSLNTLPVDVLPTVDIPAVKVIWTYSGLNAKEMAAKITSFSELAIMNNVDNVREVRSQTMNGAAIIAIDFQPSVDIDLALTQVTSVSQTILRRMPTGVTPPLVIQYNQSSTPILQLVIASNTLSEAQLSDFARLQLRSMIQSIQGIRLSLPYGGASRQVMIDLRPASLLSYGLSPADVITAISRQNLTLPSGSIRESTRDIQISVDSSLASVDAFNNIPLQSDDGRLLLLRDVADVRDGPALQTNIARVNGQNAVTVSLIKLGDASTLSIINQVLKKLPEIQKSAPEGLTISPIFDQSIFIRAAISHVGTEMIIVGTLVATIVLLFLGSWRATLIVLTSIPLSLLTAIIALKITGNTLNLMSLGGLALAIGILVDNALVEIENIKRNLSFGLLPREAALNSAQQVAFPEFVSTLSTCIVFLPIFLLTGIAGYIFRPLAIVVITALAASYFLSRTIVPVLAVMLLPGDKVETKVFLVNLIYRAHAVVENLIAKGQRKIGNLILFFVRHSLAPLFILGVVLGAGILAIFFSGKDFFPKTDAGLMRLYVRTEPGLRIEETARYFAAIQSGIREIIPAEELQFIVDIIGTPEPVNLGWVESFSIGSYDGEILIQLQSRHKSINYYEPAIRKMLKTKFPQISFLFLPADTTNQTLAGSTPSALDVRFSGKDSAGNYALAQELIAKMQRVQGATDIQLQQVLTLPEYFISIDRDRALQLGLTTQEVMSAILGILGSAGTVNPNYWADPDSGISYTVQAQTPINQMTSIDKLLNLKLHSSSSGKDVLLRTIATVTPRLVPATIGRVTLQPVYDVLINTENIDLGSLYNKTELIVEALRKKLKPGNQINIVGQAQAMHTAYTKLIQGFALALLLIYLVMVFNFQSWIMPVIALFAAPVAISGTSLFLLATSTPISVQALMGFIMVIGVSTANSVLVTTFARDLWLSGYSAMKAARVAAGKRLRPVLMTALTMLMGVFPMALAIGEGGEQNAPLARAVIGGLTFGTFASLLFVPWLFSRLIRNKNRPENPELMEF